MENQKSDASSLEQQETKPKVVDASSSDAADTSLEGGSGQAPQPDDKQFKPKKKSPIQKVQGLITHINIYLLLFIFIMILAGGFVFIGIQKNKKEANQSSVNTTTLSKEALQQISGSTTKVGDPKQTLSIESNTIFSGKVLVRDSLDVAGGIKVGSSLNLPGISVSGQSTFDQLQANTVSVTGNETIQGDLTVHKGLTISGGATFGGNISAPLITVSNFQINNDLQILHHINGAGGSPGKSDGTALGVGGTSSVSGSDTAGTVTINTGGGPPAGCFVTLSFSQHFNSTPHVVITPVGSAAAGLNYYINRSTSSFSVCTTNGAPAGQSFSFDYVAFD